MYVMSGLQYNCASTVRLGRSSLRRGGVGHLGVGWVFRSHPPTVVVTLLGGGIRVGCVSRSDLWLASQY